EIDRLTNTVKSVYQCRDLVNLPVNHLNTIKLAEKLTEMANLCKIRIEVLNKKQIESLRMGGLLSVNLGSVDPPVFIIMEFKPKRAVNKQPLVLIGKGITYDTGGLNLKTGNFMDDMKLDMGGAAAVATTLQTIALNNIPLHTIVLIPATDNRPDGNAMASGDVITMYDGTTVEVLNTDAEGRLILADALAWAKQYNPMLVVDMATLTGAAARAIGSHGIVSMHQRAAQFMEFMKLAGEQTGERIAEFPFWEEYDEQINSEIADLKNIGGPEGGAITAGKFLAHFTDYPYIHMDIAGPVFLNKRDSYRGSGATGVGVRILSRMAELLAQ
ncbi:MAG: peptidase M17, partial [Bacteroidetes bacterium HGW-Bacteroidetes-22]